MRPRPASIEIHNECPKALCLPQAEVTRNARRILRKAGFAREGLSLLLVGDRRMRTLNRRFLKHDWTTDVITFGYKDPVCAGQSPVTSARSREREVPVYAGEIIISVETAKKMAVELGHSARYEFYFYLCHGILHLAGYDDDTPRKRAAMLKRQEGILKRIGISKK